MKIILNDPVFILNVFFWPELGGWQLLLFLREKMAQIVEGKKENVPDATEPNDKEWGGMFYQSFFRTVSAPGPGNSHTSP